jgi:hypothetical protein
MLHCAVILPPAAYGRWLANIERDPRDLLVPFPSEMTKIWPIGTRVNTPANDDEGILEPVVWKTTPPSRKMIGEAPQAPHRNWLRTSVNVHVPASLPS